MYLRAFVPCVLAAGMVSCARLDLNIALVTVEALRCDAIGFYGGSDATPSLDSLATQSVVFRGAQVPQGHTWPSLTSLHTSTYPAYHGVRRNGQPMPRPLPTLATALAEKGYSTGAFLGNMASAKHPGFQRVFKGRFPSLPQHRWDEALTQEALAWVDSVKEPFFLWIHYVGPHTPYLPQSDPQPDYRGPVTGTVESLSALSIGLIPATTENVSRVRSLYLADVRSVDAQVGQVCQTLDTRGLLARTIVVVTADHGEELGEHNHYVGHANSVYQVVLGVPLIVWVPGAAPAVVAQQVEITDIAPTLLDLVRLQSPESMEGRTFKGLLAGKGGREVGAAFSEWYGEQGQAVYTVRRGRWKYVHNPGGIRPNDVPYCYHAGTGFDLERAELYDLERDPQETHNLAETRQQVVASLRAQLEDWLDTHGPSPGPAPLAPDAETLEELKALGYLK